MTPNNLKKLLKDRSPEMLTQICLVLYRQIPREKKETTDDLIEDALAGLGVKDSDIVVDADRLMDRIDDFESDVRDGYYNEDNRNNWNKPHEWFVYENPVPRSERSKWRSRVKDFLSALQKVPASDARYDETGDYMLTLFDLLSDACDDYLLPMEGDVFQVLGTTQQDVFRSVISQVLAAGGCTLRTVGYLMTEASKCVLSNSCEAAELVDLIVEQLETPEQKRLAVSAANIMVQKFREDMKDPETDEEYWETCRYAVQELNLDVLWISALLGQMNEPVMTYFFDHEVEDSPEIALWQGLYTLREHHLSEQYLALYEYAVNVRHLNPDEKLREEYAQMRKGGDLPESPESKEPQE